MAVYSEIVQISSTHVYNLFHNQNSDSALYHNYNHTLEVVSHTKEIATGMNLSLEELEIVLIAAMFHDTGYLQTREDHEELSASIAEQFLSKQHYSQENIKKVIGCIRATKVPQQPVTLLEKVICDADLLNLGKEDCIEKGEVLHKEIEHAIGKSIPEKDWLKQSINFFHEHSYHTDYVRKRYNKSRDENLKKLEEQLHSLE
ncbi:MAG: HD domain-containing protein [Bacteroidota bacterium]|nr:HD domain-containing protein [Bacteroidota bacterium]